jgi:L-lactate dehydrogenase complex protein LldG
VPRAYREFGELASGSAAVLDLLVDRLEDYRAQVVRTTSEALPQAIAAVLSDLVPEGSRVLRADGELSMLPYPPDDPTSDPVLLDAVAAVVTGCAVAIATTGTLVLDSGPECGRRALSLVPDVHLCVVNGDQVVESVPEALALLDPTRPLTFVSGPSATSDIELQRVEGVHGPRTLVVLLVT